MSGELLKAGYVAAWFDQKTLELVNVFEGGKPFVALNVSTLGSLSPYMVALI
jgi:hypothetical protein